MEAMLEKYKLESKIGCGSFGTVYRGREIATNEPVCIKRIRRNAPNFREKDYLREIEAGKRLSHPGVVKMRDYYDSENYSCIVFDYIDGIDLFELMRKRDMEPMIEEEAQKLFAQIVDALLYCHKEGISHRDLKLENIMLERKTLTPKLIDFGLCEVKDADRCMETQGSVNYCAPEVAKKGKAQPYNSFLSDVFSLGIILYALLFARFPYAPMGKYSLELDLMVPIKWKSDYPAYPVSAAAKQLLKGMLAINPMRRLSLQEVADHPWVKEGKSPNMSS